MTDEELRKLAENILTSHGGVWNKESLAYCVDVVASSRQRVQQEERKRANRLMEALKAIKNHAKICIGETKVKMSTTWNIADRALAQFDAKEEV